MDITESQARVAEAMRDLVHRTSDFDPLELLHDLTAHVAQLLPVAGAGVTVLDEMRRVEYATASDERCRHLEQVQIDLDEGPCLEATRTGVALAVTSLTGPPALRWPRFARNARRVGIIAVAAVPLRSPALTIGALNLMSDQDSDAAPDGPRLRIAQALADAAASCFGHRQEARDQAAVIEQLTIALDSRLVIEQAKGVLSERLKVSVDEAFQRLRRHARARQQKLTALAAEVAQGTVPTELAHS
ncbi:transcription antitermination regulator [Streptomyces sp. WAC 06783]|uniref:GAF and ANTAR domain-containing protein n=1 Tax=unclassified Streptomyces TaxID=2593676 RepID=UPI000F748D43|nr:MULTISPECIES: GAF and ANTAR domain-containing protein [unclassified Streptomyces]RSO03823.1 transcription antitermination regulator [Streptomyces sp. WAC 06783]RSO11435.1 transcription antitermination regulator [Streptomyces sp. WAC 06725]